MSEDTTTDRRNFLKTGVRAVGTLSTLLAAGSSLGCSSQAKQTKDFIWYATNFSEDSYDLRKRKATPEQIQAYLGKSDLKAIINNAITYSDDENVVTGQGYKPITVLDAVLLSRSKDDELLKTIDVLKQFDAKATTQSLDFAISRFDGSSIAEITTKLLEMGATPKSTTMEIITKRMDAAEKTVGAKALHEKPKWDTKASIEIYDALKTIKESFEKKYPQDIIMPAQKGSGQKM
jgi:hypothetical protein